MCPMRFLAMVMITAAAALLAAGCGSSDSTSSTGSATTATVPGGRLGDAAAECPLTLNGTYVKSASCPPRGIISAAQWVDEGRKPGVKFVVWGPVKSISGTGGFARAYCSTAGGSPASRAPVYGTDAGIVMTSPTANGKSDKRALIEDSGRALAVDWRNASLSSYAVQVWGVCVGP